MVDRVHRVGVAPADAESMTRMSCPCRHADVGRLAFQDDDRHLRRAAQPEGEPVPKPRRRVEPAGTAPVLSPFCVSAPPTYARPDALEETSAEEAELATM